MRGSKLTVSVQVVAGLFSVSQKTSWQPFLASGLHKKYPQQKAGSIFHVRDERLELPTFSV